MEVKEISVYSDDYPKALKEIHNPPQTLYSRGAKFINDAVHVAIVGTRMPSRYGLKTAYRIAEAVTDRGGVVVSGLAFGIDAICHKAAVDLKKPTIAVLGSGIDCITPRSNEALAEKILENGGSILSEFAHSVPSLKYRYLLRNRIISGMCGATIVIEAGEKSGALITARHAFEQNREVFALIGDIDRPQGAGCRYLFSKDMASPIYSINRLLTDLKLNTFDQIAAGLDIQAVAVLKELGNCPYKAGGRFAQGLEIPELVHATGLDLREILCALSVLEINGLAYKNPSGKWLADI